MSIIRFHIPLKWALATLLLMCELSWLTSCRKELCYHHYRAVAVDLEWEQEWERDQGDNHRVNWDSQLTGGEYADLIPGVSDGVTVLIYNLEDSSVKYQFINHNSGNLAVDAGTNSLMFFSNDTDGIEFGDMRDPVYAMVQSAARSRANYSDFSGEPTVAQPDMFYGAYVPTVEAIGTHDQLSMHVKMQPLVYTYVFKFVFDHGIEHVAIARGALSGMARGTYVRSGGTCEDTATILIDDCTVTDDGVLAVVRSFGPPGILDKSYDGPWQEYAGMTSDKFLNSSQCFNLEVRLTGGVIKNYYFDVTQRVKSQPSGGVVSVAGLAVEDSENVTIGSSFDVTLDPWDEVIDVFPSTTPVV